jgi:hypothetical protein
MPATEFGEVLLGRSSMVISTLPTASSSVEMLDSSRDDSPAPTDEQRGCLFALSQPPLMIFLAVIGMLLLAAAVHDLFVL